MDAPRDRFAAGFRAAVPYAIAGFVLALSFGVLATDAGFSALQAVVMSLIVYAGSAQFAALAVVTAGGGVASAVGSAALINSRFLPMNIALAPSLPGGPLSRALQGQPTVDASWALAARGDGTFDRWFLFGTSATQYLTWSTGTIAGALGGDILGNPHTLGLDAIFPTFFLALLLNELKHKRAITAAALGALIAIALVPATPPGVPVLAASLAALIGIKGRTE
jgi:4-azaleucine resistance transporter AzlC